MGRRATLGSWIVSAWLALMAAPAMAAPETAFLLKPAAVFTAEDGATHPGWTVLVRGERIVAVGPAVAVPTDARVITLPGATLIPGLIDLHSHLFLHPYNETLWDDQVMKEPLAYRTLRAGRQATATLMAGFTTCATSAQRAPGTPTWG